MITKPEKELPIPDYLRTSTLPGIPDAINNLPRINDAISKYQQTLEREAAHLIPKNPKTLMGATKVPNASVTPFTALIRLAQALEYGAFHAPRRDTEQKGYGPFNWRDNPIEYVTYIEATQRHLASAADREDVDPDTGEFKVQHLWEAMASLAILIDAIEHETVIDNRPANAKGRVAWMLRDLRKKS